MKSRNQIYRGEGERLLKLITTYHALQYEQVLQFFIRNRDSLKSLITSLIKQGRIYYNQDRNLLCDSPEAFRLAWEPHESQKYLIRKHVIFAYFVPITVNLPESLHFSAFCFQEKISKIPKQAL